MTTTRTRPRRPAAGRARGRKPPARSAARRRGQQPSSSRGRPPAGARTGAAGNPMDERMRARRAAIAAARRRRRIRAAITVAVLVGLGWAAVVLGRSPLLAVAEVRVDGVDGAAAQQVRSALDVAPGTSLLDADLAAARDRVAGLPFVADVTVDVEDSVVVVTDVQPRPPAAVLVSADASWVLDSGGVLIDGGGRPGVPVIEAPGLRLPPLGEPVEHPGVRAALRVLPALPTRLADAVRVARLDGAHVELVIDGQGRLAAQEELIVRIGSADRIAEKVEVVEAMLDVIAARQSAEEDPLGPVVLDARAPANPVLRDR